VSVTEQSVGELLDTTGPRSRPGWCASNGGHFGGVGQLDLWTEWQWVTSRDKAEPFPF
jgi:hypothetical protein